MITEIPSIRRSADRDLLREQLALDGVPVPDVARYYTQEEWRIAWDQGLTLQFPQIIAAGNELGVLAWFPAPAWPTERSA